VSQDRLSARLLVTFRGELDEQLIVMNGDLLALESVPTDVERLRSLFRVVHTLKGAARAAGVPSVERACHSVESLLAAARDGKTRLGAAEFRSLFATADALGAEGVRLRVALGVETAAAPTEFFAGAERPTIERSRSETPPDTPVARGELNDGQIRIETEKLRALVAPSGQILALADRVGQRADEIQSFAGAVGDLATDWKLAARALRVALDRQGNPGALVHAVGAIDDRIRHMARDSARIASDVMADAQSLGRATGELVHHTRRLRMRPFSDACEALPRAVRDLAMASGKEARVEIVGGEVQADRLVLDAVREAILHLVRNAVDHGIEPPTIRDRLGKRRSGTVTVSAMLAGSRLVITVADDGAGLDTRAVRDQLARRDIQAPDDDHELARMLFGGGLSTRSEATAISGRGVGLELVRAAADRIHGNVGVTWVADRGTSFTIECPPTLASIRVILASLGAQTVAIPTGNVERLIRVRPGDIRRAEGRELLPTPDGAVPLVALARVLPPLTERPMAESASVVIMRAGNRRVAVVVDELLAEQEITVRPVDGVRERLAVSGAAILGSGRVALVLDPLTIIDLVFALSGSGLTTVTRGPDAPAKRRVLVVDDSITTRTLEQSVLEAAGHDVRTAVDGADAWRMLQEGEYDLIVTDIEMPRMDGFALCEAIRASKRLHALPVVLVTALESAAHRARGLELGADAYIGKSSFDQQSLLETVDQLLGESVAR
jgi:two-component system chemotaxis sensor kinase CheA